MKRFFVFLFFALTLSLAALEGSYDWAQAKELHKEILHAFIYPKSPRPMRINVLRVDLKKTKLACTQADKDHGKPMPDFPEMKIETKRMTVKNYLLNCRKEKKDMIATVNATPWLPWQKPFTHKYGGNMALVISDGKIVSDRKCETPAIVVNKNSKVEIRTVKQNEKRNNFKMALSGFELILKDAEVIANDKSMHPRTCFGISADGRYLYLLTIDGRQKGESEGATTIECAEYLRYFGADDALNMDGGGSTTLVVWDKENKKPLTLSKQKGGGERNVAVSMGIIRK